MTRVIRTVRGDISPDTLGICAMHEHLLGRPPAPFDAEQDLVLDDVQAVQTDIRHFQQAGGRAIVEMTPIDYGRNIVGLAQIAEACDIHIVAVSGFLKEKFAHHWLINQSPQVLSQRLIADITIGVNGTPYRAGLLKAASSLHQITACEQTAFVAAALAHHATGATISTHTEAGTMAHAQVDLLTQHDVPVERIIIGHCDRLLDLEHHKSLLTRGVTIGYDQIGKSKYASDTTRAAMIAALCHAGFVNQLVIACDIARRSGLRGYGSTDAPSYVHLISDFVTLLREAGVSDAHITQMLISNPVRLLSIGV
ncbi:MAG: phosphotriesterase [Chloroflexi bacterium]|nr:phosphotriesterase [Chloroflexota bacterium]